MARVFLIYFDINTRYYPGFNHGIAYLIGTLRKRNHTVYLYHLKSEDDINQTIQSIRGKEPDLIALSFMTNQKKYVRKWFERRGDLLDKLTIAGGLHCSLVKEKVFEDFPYLNGVCIGEGEKALEELCSKMDKGEDYFTLDSFLFKLQDGKIISNPIIPLQKLETMALPDYSLFDYQRIIEDGGGTFPMLLSRGCPYNCHYCCNHALRDIYPINGEKYVRFPSIEHAIKIIKNNLLMYPETKKIAFADDTFTLNKKWLFTFCEIYRKEINLPFLCNARVENIDEQVVNRLKIAGCISIDFGVESGNEWLRKNILNRGHSNEIIKRAFNVTSRQGLKRFSFNIVGLPFETEKMMEDTFKLNIEIRPDFGKVFYFYPFPGTKLHQLCMDYNLLIDDLESVSGYLEAPSLKGIFATHLEIKKQFELLQMLFYTRLLFSSISIPLFLEKFLLKIIFLIRKPVLTIFDPLIGNKTFIALRKIMRRFAMKYLR